MIPALNEARASAVQAGAPADYARLNLDTVWSSSTDAFAFGGRGFSIFQQNADGTIVKVEETGGDFEQILGGAAQRRAPSSTARMAAASTAAPTTRAPSPKASPSARSTAHPMSSSPWSASAA